MNIEVNKDELALILDALAAMPLARTYNLFNRLIQIANPPPVMTPIPDPNTKGDPQIQ